MKLVSVVIPVYNDAERLRLCLANLRNQTMLVDEYEVIVVDNGSTDSIAQLVLEFPAVTWLRETRPGSYAARNRGLEAASGEIVAFTDSDCIPDVRWLEEGAGFLRTRKVAIAGGCIKFLETPGAGLNACELCESQLFYMTNHERTIERSRFAVTANMFALRDVFLAMGPFDPSLKSSGDRDWVQEAVRIGYSLAYVAEAIVLHPRRRTLDSLARKIRRLKGGMVALARKKPAARELWFSLRYTPLDIRLYRIPFTRNFSASLWQRAQIAWLLLRLMVTGTAETLRVWWGGAAYRGND